MTSELEQVRAVTRMSEEEFVEKCLSDMMGGWVPLTRYLKLYPEETINAIHKRVQQGHWQRQVHYAAPRGGAAWVNLKAVRLWLEGRLGPWCCEEGERLKVPMCPTCSEASAAYSQAMGPSAGTRSGG